MTPATPLRPPRRAAPSAPARGAALALAACLLAGCGGTSADRQGGGGAGNSSARGFTGDDYLRAGDPDRAAARFEADLAASPGDTALAEKLRTARRLAAQRHAEFAVSAADRGDLAAAEAQLAAAERFDATAAPVLRARQILAPRIALKGEVAGGKARAVELLATDPRAALEVLGELRRRAPYDTELVEMLTEATRRAAADRTTELAESAWAAGERRRAVDVLERADTAGRPDPRAEALRRVMETDLLAESGASELPAAREALAVASAARLSQTAQDHLRGRLAALLEREVRSLSDAGRPAAAALAELEAQRSGIRVVPAHLDRVRSEHAVVVHVTPFDDETGGSVDGLRLARAVRSRVAADAAGGSAPLVATDEPAGDAPSYPRLVLRGSARSLRITSGRVGRETRNVEYVAGMETSPNPDAAKLDEELAAARRRLAAGRERTESAETVLRELEALGFGRGPGGAVGSEAEVAHQARLAAARAELENARRASRDAEQAEFDVRQRIQATPATVSRPVRREQPIEVTTLVKTAEVVARIVLLDGETTVLDQVVTGSDVHRETTAPGFPDGGIAADPDESPDDAAMAARAFDAFASVAADAVRTAAERAARRLLERARALERDGDRAGAAEQYAVFLLTTPEVATPERAAAARALHEILGVAPAVRTGYEPESAR